mgnify:FL=1
MSTHQAKNTHLCGTAVVEFDGTLGKLGLLIKSVPAEVDEAVSEISNEFVSV